MRGGEAFIVAKAISPPRAPPLRPRKLLQVVEMCSGTSGAMDAAILDMKRCADLFVCSTIFPIKHLLPADHTKTQPFVPSIQRSADAHPTHVRPPGNSAFRSRHPAQRRCSLTSRYTTGKLSLSSQASSAALMPHPLPSNHSTSHSKQTTRPGIIPNPSTTSRPATLPSRLEKPAREACAVCRRTLQEGC